MKTWKIIMGCVLCVCLLFGNIASYALPSMLDMENTYSDTQEAEEKPTTDSKGRPILGTGEAGILLDGASGVVLYESDSEKIMYPASTTKVMTALLAIEKIEAGEASLEDMVTVTEDMIKDLPWDGSSIALEVDEVISLKNLLYGLMIPSGNDAAMAIATHIGGSYEGFIQMMNDKAAELGLKDTHFENPHGLHSDNHYTTPSDMAKMAYVAMKSEIFRNIVDVAHIKIPPTNKTEEERYYINTNGLISAMRYSWFYYPKSTGIKTGHTSQAGYCLVASASDKGKSLISVIFGGETVEASHYDSTRLLEWGFENHRLISPISENEMLGEIKVKQGRSKDSVTLSSKEKVLALVPNETDAEDVEIRLNLPEKIYAPVAKGQEVGTVSVLLDGQEIALGTLVADTEVKRSFFWPIMAFGEWLWSFLLIRVICYIFLAILGIFVLLVILRVYREIQRVYLLNSRRKRTGRRK